MANFTNLAILFVVALGVIQTIYAKPGKLLNGQRREEQVDRLGKYIVGWVINEAEQKIDIDVTVETLGFVGFGLSPKGGMAGADIIIGGIKDGEAYFKDYFAEQNGPPTEDAHQDWELLTAWENETHTYLQFTRLLNTCDDNDYPIKMDTLKIIWSMGPSDDFGYHGIGADSRNAYAVNMLDPPLPPVDISKFDRFRLTHQMTMPKQDTTYWCTVHQRPKAIVGKHHIVGFLPYLPLESSYNHTHHFSIFACRNPPDVDPEEYFGKFLGKPGGHCYEGDPEKVPLDYCSKYLFDWSIGGRMVLFPEHVGLPIAEVGNEIEFYMFEIHWDNAEEKEGVLIETGVDVLYTNEIREFDAELLVVVQKVEPSLLLPYDMKDHITSGHCSSACTAKHLRAEGVNAFNLNLHAHISARKMKVRHFRDGTELKPLGNDENYDFNYQENRPLREEVKIYPGDSLTIECTYDTTYKNPKGVVLGGFSTREEMCESYIYYYPRDGLQECLSSYPVEKLYSRFGIEEVEMKLGQVDPKIIKPEKWANRSFSSVLNEEFQWTEELKKEISNELRFGDHYDSCGYYSGEGPEPFPLIKYPEFDNEYVEEDTCTDITATTPDIPATTPDITATTPDITATTPDITATTPDITATTPDITATTPDITDTTPDITDTTPDITATTPDITDTTPDITATTPDITATTPDITATTPDITSTTSNSSILSSNFGFLTVIYIILFSMYSNTA